VDPGNEEPTRAGHSAGFWILALLAAVAATVVLSFLFLAGWAFSEREGESILVINRTSERLEIFIRYADGTEEPFFYDVPPGESRFPVECVSYALIARKTDGTTVAQRGPFESCDDSDWVIDSAP
jgi:hypothetical protein